MWGMVLIVEEFYNLLRFLAGLFLTNSTRNCERTVSAMIIFGELHETANQVFKRLKPTNETKLAAADEYEQF